MSTNATGAEENKIIWPYGQLMQIHNKIILRYKKTKEGTVDYIQENLVSVHSPKNIIFHVEAFPQCYPHKHEH